MRIYTILLAAMIIQIGHGQKIERTFGDIKSEELNMTTYEKDSEAQAIVLYDKGKSDFVESYNSFNIRYTRHRRIKILDRSATEYTQVKIPYYVDGQGKKEKVSSIEAITFNVVNGEVKSVKIDPATVYDEKVSEEWWQKKFVFPNVQDGAVLELKYELETPFLFRLPDWKFQDAIPTVYSEYEVALIPYFEYKYIAQGLKEFNHQSFRNSTNKRIWGNTKRHTIIDQNEIGTVYYEKIHTYVMRDIPAFKDESYITSKNDYIMQMDFQLAKINYPNGASKDSMSTWPAINKDLLNSEYFKMKGMAYSRYAKEILEVHPNLETLPYDEKVQKIIEYIKQNYEWDGNKSKYSSQSIKDLYNTKKGNSADINLYMISMLLAYDIDVEPIILSTRDHGKIHSLYPFDNQTNYVIALVNGEKKYLADGTEPLLPFDRIPPYCFNDKGLIVRKSDSTTWINLDIHNISLENTTISLNLYANPDSASGIVSIQSMNYDGYYNRSYFRDDTDQLKEYFSDKVGKINRIKTTNYDITDRVYIINIEIQPEIEEIGDQLILKPFLNLPISQNLLKQKERNYPVDFEYTKIRNFGAEIKIPKSLKLIEVPEPYHLSNDLVEIKLEYIHMNHGLQVMGMYEFKKPIYQPNEYQLLKECMDHIVAKFNDVVIFEKVDL
ncbi:DUF3857 domain-containing protein [Membranihabitans marinus]|uniref:DUF3857 domain-containing protein n=1 Tax=Membranihabitans marinus TaxID=1227546 RepID=UPI001F446EC7|nr:DUF3857 domain-containing protein [Membranihabitans marinus]